MDCSKVIKSGDRICKSQKRTGQGQTVKPFECYDELLLLMAISERNLKIRIIS